MKTDSLFQDTVYIHDTIIMYLDKDHLPGAESQEHFKMLITSQSDTYNFILYVFLGIITLFAGATWLYNKKIVRSEIIKETDRVFSEEKDKLVNNFKNEFKDELNLIKGENARAFAIAITGTSAESMSNKLFWWLEAADYYNKVNKGRGVRICLDNALITIKACLEEKAQCSTYLKENYPDEGWVGIVSNFPEVLHREKKELTNLIDALLK